MSIPDDHQDATVIGPAGPTEPTAFLSALKVKNDATPDRELIVTTTLAGSPPPLLFTRWPDAAGG